jgi:carbon storage regulator
MLVLSRKCGEQIIIPGSAVTITVVAIEGRQVRLGFAAPEDVTVLRAELIRRKRDSGTADAHADSPAD